MPSAFPFTSLLDDFNRADSDSLGANWTELTDLDIVSNSVVAPSTAGMAYWNPAKFLNGEVRYTINDYDVGGAFFYLPLRIALASNRSLDPTTSGDWSGYTFRLHSSLDAQFYSVDSGLQAIGHPISTPSRASGDEYGVRFFQRTAEIYRKPFGGSWTFLASRYLSGFNSEGRIGAELTAGGIIDNFAGGAYSQSDPLDYLGSHENITGPGALDITVNTPNGASAGDTLFFSLLIASSQTGSVTPPPGATQIGGWTVGIADTYGAPALGVFKVEHDGVEPTYQFTATAGGTRGMTLGVSAYKGDCQVVQTVEGTDASSTTSRDSPEIDATTGNRVIAFHGGSATFNRLDWAPPFSVRADFEFYGMNGIADAPASTDLFATGTPFGSDSTQSIWRLVEIGEPAPVPERQSFYMPRRRMVRR